MDIDRELRDSLERLADHGRAWGAVTVLDRTERKLQEQVAVSVGETLKRRMRDDPILRTRSALRGWAVAAVAGLGTLIVIGGIAVAMRTLVEPSAAPADAPPLAPTDTSPLAPSAPGPILDSSSFVPPTPVVWEKVSQPDALFEAAVLEAVTLGGPGLVAVGNQCRIGVRGSSEIRDCSLDRSAAVWVSEDAFSWVQLPHDEAVLGGSGDQHMLDVTTGDSLLVAVGFDAPTVISGCCGDPYPSDGAWFQRWGDGDAAVWVSPDGKLWQRVTDPSGELGGPGFQAMEAVIWDGHRFVAVGSDNERPAAWASVDGIAWQRAQVEDLDDSGPGFMHDVVPGGPGLVAVGTEWTQGSAGPRNPNESAKRGAIWLSADGAEWTRVPHDSEQLETPVQRANPRGSHNAMWAVAATERGLIAAGITAGGRAIWTSANGTDWTRVYEGEEEDWGLGSRDLPVEAIATDGTRYITVGYLMGSTWLTKFDWHKDHDNVHDHARTDAVVLGDALVAVGYDHRGEHEHVGEGVVWVGAWEN